MSQRKESLFINGERQEKVTSLSIVGLRINRSLAWGDHIRQLAIQGGQQLGALRRAACLLAASHSPTSRRLQKG